MMTYPPKTIPDIYEQFLKRREALIRALVDGTWHRWVVFDFAGDD